MKDQLIATLSMEPLAIDQAWLEVLVETISKSTNLQYSKVEIIEALSFGKGQKMEDTNGAFIRGDVGVVYLSGPIFPEPNLLTRWLGIGTVLPDFLSDVKALVENAKVENIIIHTNSPGGSVTGINEGSEMLSEWSKIKPIMSYSGGSNASAAYWLTSAAGKMYADATARVGSIGVMATLPNYKDDHIIEIVNSKSPKKNPDPSSKEGKSDIIKVLDSLADVFIGSVAKYRNVSEDYVTEHFGQGGVLVGKHAVEAKMIDGLKSFESLVAEHSTDASQNYFTGSVKGGFSMELTLDVLKAKYPEIYKAACAEATGEIQAQIKTKNDQIKGLEDTVVELESKLEDKSKESATLNDRVSALERERLIAQQKEAEAALRAKASDVASSTLKASTLPERIHSKVKKVVDYNAFVDDKGVLNEEGYKAALENEVKEWETALVTEEGTVSGLASNGSTDGDDSSASDQVVDRLFGHLGVAEVK